MTLWSSVSASMPDPATTDELDVTREVVLDKSVGVLNQMLGASNLQRMASITSATVLGRAACEHAEIAEGGPTPFGLRHFVAPEEGTGYWDFFRPLPHVLISISECTYRKTTWASVQGEDIYKIRLLCCGRLIAPDHTPILEGSGLYSAFYRRGADTGYFIGGGQPVRLVVIHMFKDAFEQALGLAPNEVPLRYANAAADPQAFERVERLSPKLFDAANDLLESRYTFAGKLRASFIQAKCREILALLLNDARNAELDESLGRRLSSRDRNIVEDAREYLLVNYRDPPSISLLARRVGMSATKLKSAFKFVCGSTIHAFVKEVRMRKASELLLSGDYTISEVAYAVGYDHAANFTAAFRKHYGFVPSALKPRGSR